MGDMFDSDLERQWNAALSYMATKVYRDFYGENSKFEGFIRIRKNAFKDLALNFHNATQKMKNDMKQKPTDVIRLDRSKLSSAAVKSILRSRIFERVPKKEPPEYWGFLMLPNEFFAQLFVRQIINAFSKTSKGKHWPINDDYKFTYPVNIYFFTNDDMPIAHPFNNFFMQLLYYYGQKKRIKKFPLFAVATIISCLEVTYDCFYSINLGEKYYYLKLVGDTNE